MAVVGVCGLLARRFVGFNGYHALRSSLNRSATNRFLSNATEPNQECSTEADQKEAPVTDPSQTEELEVKFNEEKEQLTRQITDITDKYKRALAEAENVRHRMQKQVDDVRLFGIQSFCKDLLEVADILGKATESVPPEEISDSNPQLKNLFEGLKLTENQLLKVFHGHGLAKISPPVGEKFDPNCHEAMFELVVDGVSPGHVAVTTKLGYTLHERTIRPAQVGVSKTT